MILVRRNWLKVALRVAQEMSSRLLTLPAALLAMLAEEVGTPKLSRTRVQLHQERTREGMLLMIFTESILDSFMQ